MGRMPPAMRPLGPGPFVPPPLRGIKALHPPHPARNFAHRGLHTGGGWGYPIKIMVSKKAGSPSGHGEGWVRSEGGRERSPAGGGVFYEIKKHLGENPSI